MPCADAILDLGYKVVLVENHRLNQKEIDAIINIIHPLLVDPRWEIRMDALWLIDVLREEDYLIDDEIQALKNGLPPKRKKIVSGDHRVKENYKKLVSNLGLDPRSSSLSMNEKEYSIFSNDTVSQSEKNLNLSNPSSTITLSSSVSNETKESVKSSEKSLNFDSNIVKEEENLNQKEGGKPQEELKDDQSRADEELLQQQDEKNAKQKNIETDSVTTSDEPGSIISSTDSNTLPESQLNFNLSINSFSTVMINPSALNETEDDLDLKEGSLNSASNTVEDKENLDEKKRLKDDQSGADEQLSQEQDKKETQQEILEEDPSSKGDKQEPNIFSDNISTVFESVPTPILSINSASTPTINPSELKENEEADDFKAKSLNSVKTSVEEDKKEAEKKERERQERLLKEKLSEGLAKIQQKPNNGNKNKQGLQAFVARNRLMTHRDIEKAQNSQKSEYSNENKENQKPNNSKISEVRKPLQQTTNPKALSTHVNYNMHANTVI